MKIQLTELTLPEGYFHLKQAEKTSLGEMASTSVWHTGMHRADPDPLGLYPS